MSPWDERVARARALTRLQTAAGELLTFYAALAERQRALVSGDRDHRQARQPAADFLAALDMEAAVAAVPGLLDWLAGAAPPRLAEAARSLRTARLDWRSAVRASLAARGHEADEAPLAAGTADAGCQTDAPAAMFVAQAAVQPFAEEAAGACRAAVATAVGREVAPATCPICSNPPVVGVLREDAQGARRSLVCGCCLTEWPYLRVVCAGCGEQQFDALPVYTADTFPQVRLEACERCHRYLKTIDLTKDGFAVPIVDDIASTAMDIWAEAHGYARLQPHLLQVPSGPGGAPSAEAPPST